MSNPFLHFHSHHHRFCPNLSLVVDQQTNIFDTSHLSRVPKIIVLSRSVRRSNPLEPELIQLNPYGYTKKSTSALWS
ncbi:hypothetical protein M378DRAFT_806821 [Amanita muscaria Koide BX008]|uniref:Uncharacterized protein n=1 Tax=Amanita muscaria (strain Koide BX008) TaxID=946122 RepID=A0A0C2X023_AMAMK|nr:hypothetical protein M378DRAFT_806821 [Amanita muscaria Koide BX008]